MAVFAGDATDSPTTAYGDLTVNQAPLTVTADAESKAYGAAVPTLAYTVTGFVNGDTSSRALRVAPGDDHGDRRQRGRHLSDQRRPGHPLGRQLHVSTSSATPSP